MKHFFTTFLLGLCLQVQAGPRPAKYTELLPYVQASPDQGEANTCWFMASTGAMELLLNKKYKIKHPQPNGRFDLSEPFLIFQKDYIDPENPPEHFLEEVVIRFNHGEAVQNKVWPFKAYDENGDDSDDAWIKHEKFDELPRIKIPKVKTKLLFSVGKKWSTDVLEESHLEQVREALVKTKSPVIINYNDDSYWHVVLIVGYNDELKGDCYQLEAKDCNPKGSFYVRDSNGKKYEARAYNWFLKMGNAAATIELQ